MGPCDWPISYSECIETPPASGMAAFEDMAVEFLWRWTGRSLGLCEVTVRPCKANCYEDETTFNGSGPFRSPWGSSAGTPWTPVIIDGLWYNVGCQRCGDTCGCGGAYPLRLPGPIDSVVSVFEDDVLLDPAAYHVENGSLLVRTDGQSWSECGLEVTYDRGVPVPVGGQVAAGVLATELYKASCGKKCSLPQRWQSITRDGITIQALDSFDDIDKGHTGIWLIDSWVASLTRSPQSSRVLSPDVPRHSPRRTTWTP